MILIISSKEDSHAMAILTYLKNKNETVYLLDLSLFPQDSHISIKSNNKGEHNYIFSTKDIEINLSQCHVIWWRRPQPFQIHPNITEHEDMNFIYRECHATFSGIWAALNPFWINNPIQEEEASKKIYQLNLAQKLGFIIPDTCITNDPTQAKQFISFHNKEGVIYKPFSGTEETWRETRLLKEEEHRLLDNVKYSPVIFQEYIQAEADLRITIVGKDIFTAAIYTNHASYKVDFRMVMNEATMEVFELPKKIKTLLLKLMDKLGLIYGAIDMRLRPNGDYVFLEINPSGQWLFVEDGTGLPITKTFAELMIQKNIQKQ